MVEDVGEDYRPFLRMWYEGARCYPGADASLLSSHAEVESEIARWAREGTGEQVVLAVTEQPDVKAARDLLKLSVIGMMRFMDCRRALACALCGSCR
jgi:hypothetical protein